MEANHLMYSKITEHVMLVFLHDHFSPEEAEKLYAMTAQQYRESLKDVPNLGGKKNSQSQSVYDCIALFALYEILPQKPALGVFEELVNQVFVPQMKRASYANLNHIPIQCAAQMVFSFLSKRGENHERQWPGNYHMAAEPYDPEIGVRFHYTTCPIADFARTHGYTHLMPAMCNPDYPALEVLKGGLIRTKTCATDDCCDYWIVGSESPYLEEHPRYRDEMGFIRNK